MEGATPSKQYQSEQKQSQTVPWLTPGQYYEVDIVAGNRAGVKHYYRQKINHTKHLL